MTRIDGEWLKVKDERVSQVFWNCGAYACISTEVTGEQFKPSITANGE